MDSTDFKKKKKRREKVLDLKGFGVINIPRCFKPLYGEKTSSTNRRNHVERWNFGVLGCENREENKV